MPIRFQPNAGAAAIVLGTSAPSLTLDALLGSTPNLFAVRGADGWEQRAIVGSDLPNPSTTSLGGVFSNPVSSNSVLSGIGNDGTPTRATTTGTGDVVRAASPTLTGTLSMSGTIVVTSSSALALAVGRQGILTPAFSVDASTASSETGVAVVAQSVGNGVNIGVTSSGGNEALIINAKGSGTISFGTISTGGINFFRATNHFGSTSGVITLQATAIAGTNTLTLPAATDTLVGKATTDTLTNKTYNTQGTGNVFTLNGGAFGTVPQARATLGQSFFTVTGTVNFAAAGDSPNGGISFTLPTGFTRYRVGFVLLSGASGDISTATLGIFTGAGGTGTQVVTAASVISVTTAAEDTNGNMQLMTVANANGQSRNQLTLYPRVAATVAQTATITIMIQPVS